MQNNATVSLRELMTRADLPELLYRTMGILVANGYQTATSNWRTYTNQGTVPDLREATRVILTAHDGLEEVLEGEHYPEGKGFDLAPVQWRVNKFGKLLRVSWEALVNDDQRLIRDLAIGYGQLAAESEIKFVSDLLDSVPVSEDEQGPLAGPLSEMLISRAVALFYERQDRYNRPIQIAPRYVVAAPRHASALRAIFRPSTALDFNPIAGEIGEIVSEPYLKNRNAIYFIADPAVSPGIQVDFLSVPSDPRENYTNGPRIFRNPAGTITGLPGDVGTAGIGFSNDTIEYKIRHVFGGAVIDPIAIVRLEVG